MTDLIQDVSIIEIPRPSLGFDSLPPVTTVVSSMMRDSTTQLTWSAALGRGRASCPPSQTLSFSRHSPTAFVKAR